MIALAWALGACTVDEYESGDGHYSYLRADFAMVHTSSSGKINHMLTDAGDAVVFDAPWTASWATKADSVYRALVYYDVSTNRYLSSAPVIVTSPARLSPGITVPTDPLTIESTWVSGGFFNIAFAVKAGRTDSVGIVRKMGLIFDNHVSAGGSRRTVDIRIFHAQNGIPEYYTVRGYMSMPLANAWQGAVIRLRANTYEGEKTYVSQVPASPSHASSAPVGFLFRHHNCP